MTQQRRATAIKRPTLQFSIEFFIPGAGANKRLAVGTNRVFELSCGAEIIGLLEGELALVLALLVGAVLGQAGVA